MDSLLVFVFSLNDEAAEEGIFHYFLAATKPDGLWPAGLPNTLEISSIVNWIELQMILIRLPLAMLDLKTADDDKTIFICSQRSSHK